MALQSILGVAEHPGLKPRRCCVAPTHGKLSATSLLDQIVKASSSNATANRRVADSSAANS
jgi:UDP-N-acetylmuramate-alanine ligase